MAGNKICIKQKGTETGSIAKGARWTRIQAMSPRRPRILQNWPPGSHCPCPSHEKRRLDTTDPTTAWFPSQDIWAFCNCSLTCQSPT